MSDGIIGNHHIFHIFPDSGHRHPISSRRMIFIQTRMLPKFTTKGFEIIQIPSPIFQQLLKAVTVGITNWNNLPTKDTTIIYNRHELSPKWLDLQELGNRIHLELLPLHEAWAGMKLIPTSSYGVRLYQNGSSLMMHCDQVLYAISIYSPLVMISILFDRLGLMSFHQLFILHTSMTMRRSHGYFILKIMKEDFML